jgi:BolA protein
MNKERYQKIHTKLIDYFQPIFIELIDESHLHAGHAGAATGLSHYALTIQSDAFKGLTLMAQHRLIYQVLGDLMHTDIHALRITTRPL